MHKTRVLCILHCSPPFHGASAVGDSIVGSQFISDQLNVRFIPIRSSKNISEIGNISLIKILSMLKLYFKVLFQVVVFRPQVIYFTASYRGVALFRDVFISSIWKVFEYVGLIKVFYHFHTKGVSDYVGKSKIKKFAINCLLNKKSNLILLSPSLSSDFEKLNFKAKIFFLPNSVKGASDKQYLARKNILANKKERISVLFLSNMMKSKGYFEVLKSSNDSRLKNVVFHFAGAFQLEEDELEFFQYIKENKLEDRVTFHGFVKDEEKLELFTNCNLFVFPTTYHNEAFPLSILEALSFGYAVVATKEGAIPDMLINAPSILIDDMSELPNAIVEALDKYVNLESSLKSRSVFINEFAMYAFEKRFVEIVNR